jgi:predicted N-formylglutamate amidohydrolase
VTEIITPLLGPDEPGPFEVFNRDGKAKCLILCEHASTRVPQKLNLLGLPEEEFHRHYGVDIGAKEVSCGLAEELDAPLIYANYSRLVVDLNRYLHDPTAFVEHGEDVDVPGNIDMCPLDRQSRIDELYLPYHRAAANLIEEFLDRGEVPAVISIHSFERVLFGQRRPWDVGVLWVEDNRLPLPMLDWFRDKGISVGDNEPYDARSMRGMSVDQHATKMGLANVTLEICNDLLRTEEGCAEWTKTVADCFKEVLADGTVFSKYDVSQVETNP